MAFRYLKLADGKNSELRRKTDIMTKNIANKNKSMFLVT
jgi:hypothetical protein